MSYQDRLNAIIPGGAHTYSRGFDQFPSNAPQILERGEGAYVWDPDGRRFLDYGMGLRSVTLGYANPRVNAAAWREIQRGNNLTRPTTVELRAAELIVSLIPGADMVKFGKSGSAVTTAAVKLARAHTGRRFVCIPRQHPFFSLDDWFIGTTPMSRGIPEGHAASTLLFDYGDLSSLECLFREHPGEIAAVMMEPATTAVPCPPACDRTLTADPSCTACPHTTANFLRDVQTLCAANGALFILDEMITGFRWHLQGAQTYFGVRPDLSTFGKGMANGFPLACVVGRRDVMQVGSIDTPGHERVFVLSTTHGSEMSSLGAFIESMAVYRDDDVCSHLWAYGRQLREGLTDLARTCGLQDHFVMAGPDIHLSYLVRDRAGVTSLPLRTLFAQEMVRGGVLMPWIAVSSSHGDAELQQTLLAARAAFDVVSRALRDGVDGLLEGPPIKPVFRKFN
jgi:glutamate-1-semialdehyde 2,1-aminomutase